MPVPVFALVYLCDIAWKILRLASGTVRILIGWHGFSASFAKVANHLAILAGKRQRLAAMPFA
jgi:hypothetical protein